MLSRAEHTKNQRQIIRFLKLLHNAGQKGCSARWSEDNLVIVSKDRDFSFPRTLAARCIDEALVDSAAERVRLNDTGLACLKRMLHPEQAFASQHSSNLARKTMDEGATVCLVNESESPLGRLFGRKDAKGKSWLSEPEFRAGERLRMDFERAGLQPRITANWEASVAAGARGAGAGDISDFAIDARQRFVSAIDIIGPELAGAVVDICCFLKGLEAVEKERAWPSRSAKLMLRTALRLLVRHYGLVPISKGGPISQWGTQDYRPRA